MKIKTEYVVGGLLLWLFLNRKQSNGGNDSIIPMPPQVRPPAGTPLDEPAKLAVGRWDPRNVVI